jgi:hypothetical protein
MKPNTLFQVRFKPSVTPPIGWKKSGHYNVLNYDRHHNKYLIGKTWLSAKDFIKIEVQDAPVFEKPVLRKITSLSSNECIEILNSETCKSLLKQIKNEGVLKIGIFEKSSIDIFPIYLYKSGKSIQLVHIRDIGCNLLPASKFVEVPQEKQEPITEPQKDECKAADERIKELERICELRLKDNDALADECDKWKTMLTATNKHIDKLRDICQIASSTGSKEIMQSVLKSIAKGEI